MTNTNNNTMQAIAEAIKAQAIKDGHANTEIIDCVSGLGDVYMHDSIVYIESHERYFVNYNADFTSVVKEWVNAEKIENVANMEQLQSSLIEYAPKETTDLWDLGRETRTSLYTTSQLINIIENASIELSLSEFNAITLDACLVSDDLTDVFTKVAGEIAELITNSPILKAIALNKIDVSEVPALTIEQAITALNSVRDVYASCSTVYELLTQYDIHVTYINAEQMDEAEANDNTLTRNGVTYDTNDAEQVVTFTDEAGNWDALYLI